MTPLRRNFIIAAAVHVVLVGGLVAWELVAPRLSHSLPTAVEVLVPADILGDLPKGPGTGRGAYAPPPPAPTETGPAFPPNVPDEQPAPPTKDTPPTRTTPNEVSVPRKATTPAKKIATAPSVKTPTKIGTPSVSSGATAGQIRDRFLKATAGGTPAGDNQPGGGGKGSTKVIGSPDGSPNGVIGGVGAGSPNWEYFQHVKDRLYEAWEMPGSVNDRKLATTVLLRVGRDGKIEAASVYRSSGNRLMDDSALAATRKVGLLDPPPAPLLKGTEAPITVVFQVEG